MRWQNALQFLYLYFWIAIGEYPCNRLLNQYGIYSTVHVRVRVVSCQQFLIHELFFMYSWEHRPDYAPIFTGGPHAIWGLTGYILNRFVKDILARYRVHYPPSPSSKWLP